MVAAELFLFIAAAVVLSELGLGYGRLSSSFRLGLFGSSPYV